MTYSEIKEMPVAELRLEGAKARRSLFQFTLEKSLNKNRYDKPHRIRQLRKDIARIETEISVKKAEEDAKQKAAAQSLP